MLCGIYWSSSNNGHYLSCYSPVARSACDALTGVLISGLSGVTWRENAKKINSTVIRGKYFQLI